MANGPNIVKLSLQVNRRAVDFVRYDFPASDSRGRRISHWWTGDGFQFRLDMKEPLPDEQVTRIAAILDSLANEGLMHPQADLTVEEILALEG